MYHILTTAHHTYVRHGNRFQSTRAYQLANQVTVSGRLVSVYGDTLPREGRLTVSREENTNDAPRA